MKKVEIKYTMKRGLARGGRKQYTALSEDREGASTPGLWPLARGCFGEIFGIGGNIGNGYCHGSIA